MGIIISDPGVPRHEAPRLHPGTGPVLLQVPSALWGPGWAICPTKALAGPTEAGVLRPRNSTWCCHHAGPGVGGRAYYYLLSGIILSGDSGPLILLINSLNKDCIAFQQWTEDIFSGGHCSLENTKPCPRHVSRGFLEFLGHFSSSGGLSSSPIKEGCGGGVVGEREEEQGQAPPGCPQPLVPGLLSWSTFHP